MKEMNEMKDLTYVSCECSVRILQTARYLVLFHYAFYFSHQTYDTLIFLIGFTQSSLQLQIND